MLVPETSFKRGSSSMNQRFRPALEQHLDLGSIFHSRCNATAEHGCSKTSPGSYLFWGEFTNHGFNGVHQYALALAAPRINVASHLCLDASSFHNFTLNRIADIRILK